MASSSSWAATRTDPTNELRASNPTVEPCLNRSETMLHIPIKMLLPICSALFLL